MIEITQEQYDKIQETQLNKELLKAINKLSTSINNDSSQDEYIAQEIARNTELISRLIKIMLTEDSKEDNSSLLALSSAIIQGMDDLKSSIQQKPTEWEFTVVRNKYDDSIETIKAKAIQ